jgi:DNA-binding NarL/FixJ family response regulator
MEGSLQQVPGHADARVVIVDDHTLFRTGLRGLLEEHGVDVVAEAPDGETAVELVRAAAPDVVLMDISLPGMSGIEATTRIRGLAPSTQVVMLTVSAEECDVERAIFAGAHGYVVKDAPVDEIVRGIRAVGAGEALLSSRIAAGILERFRTESGDPALPEGGRAELTQRETEILRLMVEGKENPEIAEQLFISVPTVKNHVSNILAKLEVENRIQAAVKAVRRRLL